MDGKAADSLFTENLPMKQWRSLLPVALFCAVVSTGLKPHAEQSVGIHAASIISDGDLGDLWTLVDIMKCHNAFGGVSVIGVLHQLEYRKYRHHGSAGHM